MVKEDPFACVFGEDGHERTVCPVIPKSGLRLGEPAGNWWEVKFTASGRHQ
jgi:hypothetical protein